MKPSKAIRILQELHTLSHDGKHPHWRGAIQEGIDALKDKLQRQKRAQK